MTGALCIAAVTAAAVSVVVLLSMYGLYRYVFCFPPKKRPDVRQIPDSRLYKEHRDKMLEAVEEMERTSYEEIFLNSQDGLRLWGKLYYIRKGAPMVIFFHGYHGTAAWDGYGFFRICRENNINILMADERTHGKSEGNVITLGIRERYDCRAWCEYAAERFGRNADIFLAGVSMGAASAVMSMELGLPENVRAVIADCGYPVPAAIIMETLKTMGLPVKLFYLLLKQGAHLFGHFDLAEATALQAVQKSEIPILFIHGGQDSIVPLAMGEELYQACVGKKERVLIEKANHANSAMTDYDTYAKAVLKFIEQNNSRKY